MKKIILTAALLGQFLFSKAQSANDSTGFHSRKLSIEEINLVSSYYHQEGDHAAVTGGIGSQKLTDIANIIDIKLLRWDRKSRKQSYGFEIGIDHYSSASSDKVDLQANSSASSADTRFYPTFSWGIENEKKRTSWNVALSSSFEFDYTSIGATVGYSKKTKNKNGELNLKVQAYLDQLKLVTPIELRGTVPGGQASRNTFLASASYSQIINKQLQVMLLADVVTQQGYLSLPFHRVYFNDGTVHQERLPDNRLKLPLGLRANYFLSDRFIIKTYYRFYTDSWGLSSHNASLEIPIKLSSFFSLSPFYRYYTQTAAKYFQPFMIHTAQEEFYVSNYDLSEFKSSFVGAGIRWAPPEGILGSKHFNMLELRYGHYTKNNSMVSDIISLNLKFR